MPGSGRAPREGNGNPLQYPCLENPMERVALQAIVHEVTRVGHDSVIKSHIISILFFLELKYSLARKNNWFNILNTINKYSAINA